MDCKQQQFYVSGFYLDLLDGPVQIFRELRLADR